MTLETIIDILLTAAVIILSVVNTYKNMGKTIDEKARKLIAEVAQLDILGSEKMQRVVDELYEKYVPNFFKSFMTKEKLEEIAQDAYDDMKRFAVNDGKGGDTDA